MHLIEKGEGFRPFFRQVQIDQHTAVLFSLQLIQRDLHLGVGIFQRIHHVVLQCDIPLVHLVIQKHEHIDKRYAVGREAVDNLCIIFIVDRIGHIQHFGNFIVQFQKFRKVPGGQFVGQHIAAHGFRVGKAQGMVDLRPCIQFGKQLFFLFIIAGGDDQGHHIGIAEAFGYHLIDDHGVALHRCFQHAVSVNIGAFRGYEISGHDQDQK